MENKINIAKLLRNCSKGMPLDCTMYDRVTFEEVVTIRGFDDKERVKIILSTHYSDGTKDTINLTEFGTYTDDENAKCVIFPKGKITWEGFVPYCQFKDWDKSHLWTIQDAKDGDILCTYECSEPKIVFILKGIPKKQYALSYHCFYNIMYPYFATDTEKGCLAPNDENVKPATKEQRDLIFQKIKEAGYKWNEVTKTLVKLPKFKVGDRIKCIKTGNIYEIIKILSNYYIAKYLGSDIMISWADQDEYVLGPNKFDINNLKPFDKVLVRDYDNKVWKTQFFERLNNRLKDKFICMGGNRYHQCIPYEGNENLLNYSNKPQDFYINWE